MLLELQIDFAHTLAAELCLYRKFGLTDRRATGPHIHIRKNCILPTKSCARFWTCLPNKRIYTVKISMLKIPETFLFYMPFLYSALQICY